MRALAPGRPPAARRVAGAGSGARRAPAPPCAVKRGSDKHVVCSKTLVAKEGEEEAVNQLCAALVAAAGPRPADGVLEFSYGRDAYDGRTFHFWERYTGNVALGRHNTRADVEKFMEEVVPHLEGPIGMALYEWRNGQLGPACAQGGPKGEGGLDDATGGSGMAGGAGLKQTSAALDVGMMGAEEEGTTAAGKEGKEGAAAPPWGFRLPWQQGQGQQ